MEKIEFNNLLCLNLKKINGQPRKSSSAYKNLSCRCQNCVLWSRSYDKYRIENNEMRKKQVKKSIIIWGKKNIEKRRLSKLKWRKENIEKHLEQDREQKRRRRALKKKNISVPYKEKQIVEMYGSSCHICLKPIDLKAPRSSAYKGWEYGLQFDHVIPISKGGADILENVRPTHGICNIKKGAKI